MITTKPSLFRVDSRHPLLAGGTRPGVLSALLTRRARIDLAVLLRGGSTLEAMAATCDPPRHLLIFEPWFPWTIAVQGLQQDPKGLKDAVSGFVEDYEEEPSWLVEWFDDDGIDPEDPGDPAACLSVLAHVWKGYWRWKRNSPWELRPLARAERKRARTVDVDKIQAAGERLVTWLKEVESVKIVCADGLRLNATYRSILEAHPIWRTPGAKLAVVGPQEATFLRGGPRRRLP